MPSMGSVGDCYDNSMIESIWSRIPVELLNRRKWRTQLEQAIAMFDHLEIWHKTDAGDTANSGCSRRKKFQRINTITGA